MKTKIIIALLFVMGLAIGSADAQVKNHRGERARIAQGVRSGELNRAETHRLVREQRRIHRHTRRARMNDGHIGPHERRMLTMEKRRASHHIYRYKHNRFDRK